MKGSKPKPPVRTPNGPTKQSPMYRAAKQKQKK